MRHRWPNIPVELTAHSAGLVGESWHLLLWAAAQRERVCRACGHARECKSPVQVYVEPQDKGSARASPRGGV
jgi:hypothetical protein